VAADVVQGFLDGSVEGEPESWAKAVDGSVRFGDDGVRHVEPVAVQRLDEGRDGVHRRFGGATRGVGVAPFALPKRAEEGPHLGDRLPRRGLDRRERCRRSWRIHVEDAPRCAGLDTHDGNVMRDDIVQLAGDPEALLDDGVLLEFRGLFA
jgi:hypothetical protein